MDRKGQYNIQKFNDLHIGQCVKIRVKRCAGKPLRAVAISVIAVETNGKPQRDSMDGFHLLFRSLHGEGQSYRNASIESSIQEIDHQNKTLAMLNQKVALPKEVEVKGLQGGILDPEALQPGMTVKLQGTYSPLSGFIPEQIKVQENGSFHLDLLQGHINHINRELKILNVAGVEFEVDQKTMITGL